MKIVSLILLVFGVLTISAQEKVDKTPEVTLKVDAANKKISFPVQFVSSDQLLEVFACTEQGPTHETVLLIEPLGVKLYDAIKQMGLTESIHWQYPLEDGFQMTMGDKVIMKIYFEGKTEADAIFVEDLLVYDHTETPAFLRGWSFKGDQLTVEGKTLPMPDVEFSLINKGRNKSPTTLLLNPSNFFMIDEPEYKVAPKFKPLLKKLNDPEKTKGTIVLSPASEEFIATQNVKRYQDKEGLLSKNIELAKKIDALKLKFISETRKALMETIKKGSEEGVSEADKNSLIQKHQVLALAASRDLLEINYIYHQMAKNEYEYLLKQMPAGIEATKTFKFFAVELIGYLTKEIYYKFQSKLEEALAFDAKLANQPKSVREHETKRMINAIYADVQPMKFRQVALIDQIETETNKLKEPEIASSKIMKDTFEKSVRKASMDKDFFKGIENYHLKKIEYLQDTIKEGVDETKISDSIPSGVAAKISLLETVNLKFTILEFAHKDRLKLLNDYMLEDKKETEYYKKKIAETEEQLQEIQKATIEIKKIIESKAPNMKLEELEVKYKEHLDPK